MLRRDRQHRGAAAQAGAIIEVDPGGYEMKVTPEYESDPPTVVAILPFADEGNANATLNKISIKVRSRREKAVWSWTDSQRLQLPCKPVGTAVQLAVG